MATVPHALPDPSGPLVGKWLSLPRFDVCLAAAKDDRARALATYEWNSQLAAAVLHDLGHLEVALRNAYDSALQSSWQGTGHWLSDPASPVRRPEMRTRRDQLTRPLHPGRSSLSLPSASGGT